MQTDYALAADLQVDGEMLATFDVDVEAPNDIAASTSEHVVRLQRAATFCAAVVAGWSRETCSVDRAAASALIIHHLPGRDEDNTWETWSVALCGVRNMKPQHWAARAPLAGWKPMSLATICDSTLDVPVRYEIWGRGNSLIQPFEAS